MNLAQATGAQTRLEDGCGRSGGRCTYPALVSTSGWMTVLAIVLAAGKRATSTDSVVLLVQRCRSSE